MRVVVHLPDTWDNNDANVPVEFTYEKATVNYNYDDYIVVSHPGGRALFPKRNVKYIEEFV